MLRTSRGVVPLLLAVAALFLAGCGDGDVDSVADEPDAAASQDATDDGADESAEDGGDTVTDDAESEADLADVEVGATDLGEVLVDADGMTLYVFSNDSGGQSVCYDDCAAAWPPLTVDGGPVAGERVDEGLLGTTERDDGSIQVTYDGWPLYTWESDSGPGDATGQGVNDVWFVVSPDGQATMDSDDPASGAGGY